MAENEKSMKPIIHTIITLVLMFGVGFLPQVSLLTRSGMQILGILLGVIYGVTFCQVVWPCLMGMGALMAFGVAPMSQILATGLGSDSIMLMLFFFAFTAILEQNKITEFLATWMITRKVVKGKPWLFSYIMIIGTMFAGAIGSSFPAMIVFWGILIATCKLYDIKPFTKYPTVMFMGIAIGGLASSSTWLFRGNPLFVNSMLKNVSQGAVALNFGRYAAFSFIMWMIVIAGYILMCKYILKIDLGMMANIDDSVVNKEHLNLNTKQKVVFGYVFLVLLAYCGTGFIPQTSPIGMYLAGFGTTGPLFIILALMSITRVNGEPIADVAAAAKNGVNWDPVILSGVLLGLSTIMMTSETGIAESIMALLGPVFAGKGTVFMCVIICVISVILTNLMANTTVGLMFAPVILSFSASMGFNPLPMVAMMLISIHIAYLTPAASPFASLLFGYSNWVRPGDIYKYGLMTCICMVVVFLIIGIPLSNILI